MFENYICNRHLSNSKLCMLINDLSCILGLYNLNTTYLIICANKNAMLYTCN